jgi:hypothetical protein
VEPAWDGRAVRRIDPEIGGTSIGNYNELLTRRTNTNFSIILSIGIVGKNNIGVFLIFRKERFNPPIPWPFSKFPDLFMMGFVFFERNIYL